MSNVSLTKLSPKVAPIVSMALDLGWKPKQTTRGGVMLSAPDRPTITIDVPPVRQWNAGRLDSMARRIVKYADNAKLLAVRSAIDRGEPGITMSSDSNIERGTMLEAIRNAAEAVEDLTGGDLADIMANAERDLGTAKEPKSNRSPVNPLEEMAERGIQIKQRHVPVLVSEKPWMARRGPSASGGQVYPSEVVIERTYDDHSVDYACVWPGCDFTSPHPRSVANHFGATKSHQLGHPAAQSPSMKDPEYTDPIFPDRSVKARIARLEREIATAWLSLEDEADLLGGNLSGSQFARLLAEKIVKHREENRQTADDHAGEPLTTEQILLRIRALVDDGTYLHALNQVAEIRLEKDQAIEAARKERAELLADLEHATAALDAGAVTMREATARIAQVEMERDRYRDRWQGLRAIVDSEVD